MALPFIRRAQIENFRSIAHCDVELGPLMFIVGRNGSGKSNFLDALRFVAEALRGGPSAALIDRGGLQGTRRKPYTNDPEFKIRLELNSGEGVADQYEIAVDPRGQGRLTTPKLAAGPKAVAYQKLQKQLEAMAFYSPALGPMRQTFNGTSGAALARDGSNISVAVRHLAENAPDRLRRIEEYLRIILPDLQRVRQDGFGPTSVLRFDHGGEDFDPALISDGTLRALGVLIAVLGADAPLVAIEEPELSLHPAAFGVLRDALREASESRQILVTCQSPELLTDKDVTADQILAAEWRGDQSVIGPIAQAEATMLRNHLVTAGELLHQNALNPGASSQSA